MDERLREKALRKTFSGLGWALLIYMGIMNLCVSLVCVLDVIVRVASHGLNNLGDNLYDSLMGNGWGYVLAILIGCVILWLWKGKTFCCRDIWETDRPMRATEFLPILCIFVSCQLLFQIMASVQELFLNQFGLSALDSVAVATASADTFSMFFYMGILAPIAEEILFRGLVLRTLLPHGKRFAILLSAFLFGLFHGNLVQSPYAFCVGLVLGYVAIEYSIAWAMVLHMFNNLIVADVLTRLTEGLSAGWADWIFWIFMVAASIAALVTVIIHRKEIKGYIRDNKVEDTSVACFFTAPGILVLMAVMLLNMASSLLIQLF